MGKRSVYSGESPKDRSTNIIDKFITKNANKIKNQPILPGRRKDPNVPIDLWPLKDQIAYYENRTDADKFDEQYSVYSTWYNAVKERSGLYHQTFTDFISKLKPEMQSMWERKLSPKEAVLELRKKGVY
jgi:arginyl-tRNA--protein-N-Asp/Glu arginylyltransferase